MSVVFGAVRRWNWWKLCSCSNPSGQIGAWWLHLPRSNHKVREGQLLHCDQLRRGPQNKKGIQYWDRTMQLQSWTVWASCLYKSQNISFIWFQVVPFCLQFSDNFFYAIVFSSLALSLNVKHRQFSRTERVYFLFFWELKQIVFTIFHKWKVKVRHHCHLSILK